MYCQVGNQTDQALAQLYAHVQSMPESAHKRRLVSKLNEANGRGTPEVATSGSVRTIGRMARTRRKSGDGFINLLTPRRKRPVTGSYSVKSARSETFRKSESFRRQNSLAVTPGPNSTKKLPISNNLKGNKPIMASLDGSSKNFWLLVLNGMILNVPLWHLNVFLRKKDLKSFNSQNKIIFN